MAKALTMIFILERLSAKMGDTLNENTLNIIKQDLGHPFIQADSSILNTQSCDQSH